MNDTTADSTETIYEEGGKIYTNLVPRQPPKKRLYRLPDVPPHIDKCSNKICLEKYPKDLNDRICNSCFGDNSRQVIDNIHTKYNAVIDKLNLILRKLDKWDHEKALEKKGLVEKPSYLPLKNMEEFTTHSYHSESEFSQLVEYFVYLGGANIKKQISNMVSACITPELAIKMSLSKSKKVGFHNSQITDAIYAATQRWKVGGKLTRESMMVIINQAVRSMKERHRYYNCKLRKEKKRARLGLTNKKTQQNILNI
ncbi:uncharacterized LOC118074207 [Chelonus insularis]|uniref:uncharacterized LOC118074207 n=1 Tax=Chelonus insularis TaxID=460826 RepID=UPI00158E09DE|nr:uncharacterized LOC118074207 [Chelonus insularis]KAG8148376.1 CiV21p1-like protein [Chelonus insularis]